MNPVCVVALLLFSLPSAARPLPGVSDSKAGKALLQQVNEGMGGAKRGDWATYRLDGGGGRVAYWRLAVVGEEKDPLGRDAFWVEVDIGEHPALKAPLMQMRLLVAKETGLTQAGISRAYVAFAHEKPEELGEDSLAFLKEGHAPMTPAAPARTTPTLTLHTGKEARVMTPAGTVRAVPLEVRLRQTVLKRLWMSREIPVLHLVKLEIPAIRHALEVHDFGTNAQPQMVLPSPTAPKVRMERYDEALPGQ